MLTRESFCKMCGKEQTLVEEMVGQCNNCDPFEEADKLEELYGIPKWQEDQAEFLDTRKKHIEININQDGSKVWVNSETGCILRVQNIDSITINDARKA